MITFKKHGKHEPRFSAIPMFLQEQGKMGVWAFQGDA